MHANPGFRQMLINWWVQHVKSRRNKIRPTLEIKSGGRAKMNTPKVIFFFIAALRRPKAAMRSPIPIEPVYSFSYGYLCQRQIARGSLCTATTTTSRKMAPILANLCMGYIFAIWYWRSILWSIDSYSTTWPYRGHRLELIEIDRGQVFFEVNHWPNFRASSAALNRGRRSFKNWTLQRNLFI